MRQARHFKVAAVLVCALAPVTTRVPAAETDTLTAKDDERTVALAGGATLRLAPGTVLVQQRALKLDLDGPRAEPVPVDVYRLDAGSVDVFFPESGPRRGLMVRAPRQVTGVGKQGHFRVSAGPEGSGVAAFSHELLAAVGNDWKPLPEGQLRGVGDGSRGAPRAIVGKPTVEAEQPLWLAGSDKVRAAVHWQPVSGAQRYVVTLVDAQGRPLTRTDRNTSRFVTEPLAPGSYRVRVAALDSLGMTGPIAESKPLRVVGFELPEGARVDGRTLYLYPNQRARLLSADGVEVTYGQSSYFVSAPASVGLMRGKATSVRLRAVGSQSEVSLRLEPMRVVANVEVGPQRARWPGDRVSIGVKLIARGTEAPKANVQVTVNGKPVAVRFVRKGNELKGSLGPSGQPGPWVVRVDVKDPRGASLGRGFLEVAPADPPKRVADRGR